jgi:hypothetical protein
MYRISDQVISFFESRKLHNIPPAEAEFPFSLLAPSLRFTPKRSRALANASLTKLRLAITAPSVK